MWAGTDHPGSRTGHHPTHPVDCVCWYCAEMKALAKLHAHPRATERHFKKWEKNFAKVNKNRAMLLEHRSWLNTPEHKRTGRNGPWKEESESISDQTSPGGTSSTFGAVFHSTPGRALKDMSGRASYKVTPLNTALNLSHEYSTVNCHCTFKIGDGPSSAASNAATNPWTPGSSSGHSDPWGGSGFCMGAAQNDSWVSGLNPGNGSESQAGFKFY